MVRVEGSEVVQSTADLCHLIAGFGPIVKGGSRVSEKGGAEDCLAQVHIAFVCRYEDMEEPRVLGRCYLLWTGSSEVGIFYGV